MSPPDKPKIYHIVHIDRLSSIISDRQLWCDAHVTKHNSPGTKIGLNSIKQRRLTNKLNSHPGLYVGECIPFYFCPRSVMLYVIHQANHPELSYIGGQDPLIHLEADLIETVSWAEKEKLRWAFTLSNAGAYYFEDRCDLSQLNEIDWNAVNARDWKKCKENKQAEFLIEGRFPWRLISRIGVRTVDIYEKVSNILLSASYKPYVQIIAQWYY